MQSYMYRMIAQTLHCRADISNPSVKRVCVCVPHIEIVAVLHACQVSSEVDEFHTRSFAAAESRVAKDKQLNGSQLLPSNHNNSKFLKINWIVKIV